MKIQNYKKNHSINKDISNSEYEISYLFLRLQPLIYQDDLSRMSTSAKNAQAGNDIIEHCMESKLLDLHPEKSCYIVFGKDEVTKNLKKEIEENPLSLYGKKMTTKESEK